MLAKLPVVAAAASLLTALAAQTSPPPIPPELRARFGFTGPLIAKIGDGIHGLRIEDLDGDGKKEAIVVDARRARLVSLAVAGDAIEQKPIPTDGQISGYAVADVHGDGKQDLLIVDARGELSVRPGGGGKPFDPIDLGLGGRGVGILTADFDGDGAGDVIAASRAGLRWVTGLGKAPKPSPIEPLEENARGLIAADVDGDGVIDLAMIVPGPAMTLRIRRGGGDGTFGPWLLCDVDQVHHVFRVPLDGNKPGFATIEAGHRRVALHALARAGGEAALEWWPFGENRGAGALPFATGDLDGDGDLDLALAQPERARLLLFLAQDGTFVQRTVPSLAGITSLAAGDVDGDGKTDLVMASPEEDALAWKSGALPLDAFPDRLPASDKPVAVAIAPGGGVLVLARTEKRQAHLSKARPGTATQKLLDMGRLPADPLRLLVADVGGAEGVEVAFVVPGEGLRITTLPAETLPAETAAAAAPAAAAADKATDVAGFTKKIEDGAVALATHENEPALLAVRDRFLRLFRLDAQGQPRVLAQDNGPGGAAEIGLAALLPDGGRLYLDRKANKLLRSRAGAGAVLTSIAVPPHEFTHVLALDGAALLLGPLGVLRVPFGEGPTVTDVAVHEPPTVRTHYWHGVAGDFDHDGAADLAMLDGRLPGVQILAGGKDALARALAMPVFEVPPSEQPENEPRELAAGDLDGDGRCDLAIVAHDRVLIYLQEK